MQCSVSHDLVEFTILKKLKIIKAVPEFNIHFLLHNNTNNDFIELDVKIECLFGVSQWDILNVEIVNIKSNLNMENILKELNLNATRLDEDFYNYEPLHVLEAIQQKLSKY